MSTYIPNSDFLIEVAKGNIPKHSIIHKFGSNASVGTSITPITTSGLYQTPTSAIALEILSSDLNDTSIGTGARTVFVEGLDASGLKQNEEVTMNGVTPVVLANSYFRVFRMYVMTSGTYGTATASSHAGTLTLRVSGGGVTWALISVTSGFGLSQTQIGAYSIPVGFTAQLLSIAYSVDSNKTVDLYLLKRENITDVTTPFSPIRLQSLQEGISGVSQTINVAPDKYEGGTDIGFMGAVSSGTASVSVEFQLLLIED